MKDLTVGRTALVGRRSDGANRPVVLTRRVLVTLDLAKTLIPALVDARLATNANDIKFRLRSTLPLGASKLWGSRPVLDMHVMRCGLEVQ